MNCPNCGKTNAESASFCIFCGAPITTTKVKEENAPRFKGSLSSRITAEDTKSDLRGKETAPQEKNDSYNYSPTSAPYDDSGLAREEPSRVISSTGLKSSMGKPPLTKKGASEDVPISYCKKCGRKLRAGEECPICNQEQVTPVLDEEVSAKKKPKIWLVVTSIAAILVLAVGLISAISKKPANTVAPSGNQEWSTSEQPSNSSSNNQATVSQSDPLSATCDFVLCVGNDKYGNKYELVANQNESSRGFEISVGVIKNNTWIYPLSSDFPFLGDDGLFHVSVSVSFVGDDAGTGTSLLHPNRVIDKLYFIDSGAFLMECYRESQELFGPSETYYLLFSCETLSSLRIDRNKTKMIYRYNEPTFVSGQVESYGQIFTDNGELILYEETSGTSSGWTEDQVFRWDILNTKTLTTTTIASGVKGVRPRSVLSEGLFFCTDKCFYNTNGQQTVDLTDYGIDVWDSGDIFFEGGTCTFEVKNSLGTRFLITIDSSGALIREQQA